MRLVDSDVLIWNWRGQEALEHKLELVTSNTKHFRRIAGLKLLPYRPA